MNDFIQQQTSIQCPYCWEIIEVLVDCSETQQNYIEDCQVCCRPIVFDVTIDSGNGVELYAKTEDE
ncbi:CPXCG motif-containing cysteine-rich protein [Aliikangiella maris]|uniref:CPXCG motif-containing cysteine-rich protein n=2 Tax=Aliikangiella maris TaxID=3162458 RepID=A0ABV2BTE1_9GAMM